MNKSFIFNLSIRDKAKQEVISPKELLAKKNVEGRFYSCFYSFIKNCKDLLPDQEQLQLLIQHKQTSLSVEKQKELTQVVLDHIVNDTPLDYDNLLNRKDECYKNQQQYSFFL